MILLLADENFPKASFDYLLQKEHDIKSISLEHSGITDTEVIELAMLEDRVIITFDSDFGELVFKLGYQPKGLIYFRWQAFRPIEPGEYLHQLIETAVIQFEGFFTVIGEKQIRQRKI